MKCDICGKEFEGHGHNPWPLKGDICCTECNNTIVIPERILRMSTVSGEE